MNHLMAPYVYFDHELEEVRVLGSCTYGYVELKQHTSLEASIRPRRDGPGADATALHRFQVEDRSFRFVTYIFLSH